MISPENYRAIILGGAIGDALGWPFEFPESARRHARLKNGQFISWEKTVGGEYWGYTDEISAGSYSDDTQLTLSVSRSIDFEGRFLADKFAYEELPLWLQYERGGGRATKYAITSLLSRKSTTWDNNFFKTSKVSYRNAGANGAAMRCAPIVMANIKSKSSLISKYLNENTLTTHGHPRAIIGSYLIAAALISALNQDVQNVTDIQEIANELALEGLKHIKNELSEWVHTWNKEEGDFDSVFIDVISEMNNGLDFISTSSSLEQCISHLRADVFSNKGSGISSTLTAIASFLIGTTDKTDILTRTAYYQGIDTDTVSSMVGWLLGAKYGEAAFNPEWLSGVQDSHYLSKIGESLFDIAFPEKIVIMAKFTPLTISKRDYLSRVWAWEIGMFEMFWDAIEVGSIINHPTLGQGRVIKKIRNNIAYERQGKPKYYNANVIIRFIDGQTCSFHAVINENGLPDLSLTKRLENILK